MGTALFPSKRWPRALLGSLDHWCRKSSEKPTTGNLTSFTTVLCRGHGGPYSTQVKSFAQASDRYRIICRILIRSLTLILVGFLWFHLCVLVLSILYDVRTLIVYKRYGFVFAHHLRFDNFSSVFDVRQNMLREISPDHYDAGKVFRIFVVSQALLQG